MCGVSTGRDTRGAHGVSIISIATATHFLGNLDLEILETAARPGYGTSLPVRKHRGSRDTRDRRRRIPGADNHKFPHRKFHPEHTHDTDPVANLKDRTNSHFSVLRVRRGPCQLWNGQTSKPDGSCVAIQRHHTIIRGARRHARRAAFLRRLRGIRLRIRVRTVSLKNTKQKN